MIWHLSYGEWHHLLPKFNFDSKSPVKSTYPPSWLNNIIKPGHKHCTLDSEMSVHIIGFKRLRLDKVHFRGVWGICAGSSAVGFFTEPRPEQQDFIKEERGILPWSGSSSGARAGRPLIAGVRFSCPSVKASLNERRCTELHLIVAPTSYMCVK